MKRTSCPLAQKVQALASKWAAKHPELAARIYRAVALVAGVKPGDYSPNVYFVEGTDGSYIVRVNRTGHSSTCNCPDSKIRGAHCKHRIAVALYETA